MVLAQADIDPHDTVALAKHESYTKDCIKLHKLSHSYDTKTALKEVSLEMRAGEVTALLGHNGAGKTTMVKCLSGLLRPSHGQAFMFGRSVLDEGPALRQAMSTCPQVRDRGGRWHPCGKRGQASSHCPNVVCSTTCCGRS